MDALQWPASVVVFAVPLATTLAFAVWVYRDATVRGSDHALGWATLTALGGLGGIVYLLVRARIGDRTYRRTTTERVALAVWVGGLNAFALAAVVAPPDPITQGLYAAGAFVVATPSVYAVAVLRERDTR